MPSSDNYFWQNTSAATDVPVGYFFAEIEPIREIKIYRPRKKNRNKLSDKQLRRLMWKKRRL